MGRNNSTLCDQHSPGKKSFDTKKFGSILCPFFKKTSEHLPTLNLISMSSASDQDEIPAALSRQKAGGFWYEETCWIWVLLNKVK